MPDGLTISASEFKARCLEILDRLASHTLERVTITKRGHVVGILLPPGVSADSVRDIHGFMRGSVVIPEDFDLTAPIADDAFDAANGILHG